MKNKILSDGKDLHKLGLLLVEAFLLILPFSLASLWYVRKDPFMVLRHYSDYDHSEVFQNEGTMSWYKYKLYRNKMHYDSFLMGNSCTKAFMSKDWNRYIHGMPFRLFNNAEGVADLYYKLAALDAQKNQPINNLLIIADRNLLRSGNIKTGFMHVMQPEVSHVSEASYQFCFIQGFFSSKFTLPYLDYSIFHVYRRSFMDGIINPYGIAHVGVHNDAFNPKEMDIKHEKEKFWHSADWQKIFNMHYVFQKDPPYIGKLQQYYLMKIKGICIRHHTKVKLVISPSLNLRMMNEKDISILDGIFGKENVFDYSRKNVISDNYHNFFDLVHYRPCAGRRMLKYIYRNT